MMPLDLPPLPQALAQCAARLFGAQTLPEAANPGLVWSRFPRVYVAQAPARGKEQKEFLSNFVKGYAACRTRGAPLLDSQLSRLSRLAVASIDVRTTAPFATGLGLAHPVENGMVFDPLLGVPMFAGTGLKGLTRAGARLLDVPDAEVKQLLGSPPPSWGASEADLEPGVVTFYGAWPTRWPELKVELINPHHPAYQRDQARPPADRTHLADYTEEPVPVAFLAMKAGVTMRVFLGHTARAPADAAARVLPWLEAGLDFLGAGAKTGSGFGRMIRVS